MRYIKLFESYQKPNPPYYFLRWSSDPKSDEKRNFSGHMQTWTNTEQESIEYRKGEESEGRTFLYDIKQDPVSGMWNYDPEWGISGYWIKDEKSFNRSMENINEISWHHKDNNNQDLCLFKANELGDGEGYDGEELFRDIEFIDYVDENLLYIDFLNKIEYNKVNENKSHLIEVKCGRYLFHVSNPYFRDDIEKQGLIPKGKSVSWLSDTNIDGKVIFASTGKIREEWFDSVYDDDVYRIDTKGLNLVWYEDPNFVNQQKDKLSKFVITYSKIPKENIKLIYRGNGESIN